MGGDIGGGGGERRGGIGRDNCNIKYTNKWWCAPLCLFVCLIGEMSRTREVEEVGFFAEGRL